MLLLGQLSKHSVKLWNRRILLNKSICWTCSPWCYLSVISIVRRVRHCPRRRMHEISSLISISWIVYVRAWRMSSLLWGMLSLRSLWELFLLCATSWRRRSWLRMQNLSCKRSKLFYSTVMCHSTKWQAKISVSLCLRIASRRMVSLSTRSSTLLWWSMGSSV